MRKRTKRAEGHDNSGAGNSAATLTRGLEILRAFKAEDATLGNQDLIERTRLPKATISRLTATLVSLGYLHYDDDLGRYSIGPATVSLGYSALSSSAVVHMARPLMQELANETGAAVALGMRDGAEMVYAANCRSMAPVSLQLNVGSRLPIWRTAMGLAYVADSDPATRKQLVAQMVAAEPARKGKIIELVDQAVVDLAERGFVSIFGTWYSYINAVGVTFKPTDGSPRVALTCGGIVDIVPREACLEVVGPKLVKLVTRLGAVLEGRPAP
ncbi:MULTISPECIES: IclR family transcriptional regulator [Mesorhizobium]|uniref:IclR family transcriptional regulator n=1 Tax=Mesorhizobium denitrificans TaxID=2294114 RepID=A0A371XI65_9HYPH|nr:MULTISPECIES: IclR family transcriptional regulator [Mesorhizobium]RFC68911.1 IclR family transcriptional regulator [Mesorhizobium denitrificans]